MQKYALIVFITLFSLGSKAQDSIQNPLLNSGDLIGEGISYHDKQQYDSAITKYNLIDRNDTNYTVALYEKSYSLIGKKDYAASIKAIKEALSFPYEQTVEMYISLGSALDDSGNTKEAIRVYNKAIESYPYLFILRYNLAVTLQNDKNFSEAAFQYQKAINYNPFHASSYLALGKMYYNQGRKIPAMLCLGMFLVIEPSSERALNVSKMLKRIADGSIDQDKDVKPISAIEDKQFALATEILNSKVAGDKRYKTEVDIQDILVRQFHVVLENIKYDEKDTSFISKYIISYMKPMFTSGHFEPFAYYLFSSYNNNDINKWFKKNEKTVNEFKQWSTQKIVAIHSIKTMTVNGNPIEAHCYFRNNGRLQSFGIMETKDGKDKKQGTWTYLSTSGNIETMVSHNDKGEADGECKMWSKNRSLFKDYYFKNDEQDGSYLQYYENGNVKFKATYIKGKLQGKLYKYYQTGNLRAIENVVNDTLNGRATYYNRNGEKSAELKYLHAMLDSVANYYYPNGKLQNTVSFINDKRNGTSISYYQNGQIESKGDYKNGHEIGKWVYFWENGKVKTEAEYSDDSKRQGQYKQYNEDGILNQETTYINNKLNGKTSAYTDDAKLWYTVDYKNGNLKKITTFTASTGAVCAEFEDKGKRLPVTFMTPKCQKDYEGMFYEGSRDGAWKHFYTNGNLKIDETYSKGNLTGLYTKYFKIGTIDVKVPYSNNEKNGYYNEYYQNGEKYSEGWYRNGEKQGYWYYYNPDGIKTKTFYYLDDKQRGYQSYYNINGKLDYEMYYREGLVEKYIYYDTTSNVVFENKVINGNGHIIATFFNGKKRFEGEMTNGNFNGAFKRYYSNGAVMEECTYLAGNLIGKQKQYHRNGSVLNVVNYVEGEEDGKATWNYKNGTLQTSGTFKKGDKNGIWEWFDEVGRKTVQRTYKNGEYNGDQIWYDSTGTAMMKLVFDNGDLFAYSYLDKNKTFLPNIPIQDESAKIKSYYPNGNVATEIEYKKGVIVGEYKTYYQSGKIMGITPYKDNKVSGVVRKYYESGKTRSEVANFFGNQHGKSIYYRPDGAIERTEQWLMDEKHGVFEYFDTKGKLVKKENYVYNELFE